MSFDELLNNALNQTFNDEYARITSRPLGNSEAKNIDDVFQTITNREECLICCDDDKICIKCFQCTAFYCKPCLIKIASDFNKCSTCNVSIKDNYKKLKIYNEELQDTLQYEKAIANSLNDYISNPQINNNNKNKNKNKPERPSKPIHLKLKNSGQSSNNNNKNNKNTKENSENSESDDSESESKSERESESESEDNEDERINNQNNQNNENDKNKPVRKNKNNNAKGNLKPSIMNMFKSNKKKDLKDIINNENNDGTSYNKNFKFNNTSNIIDRKKIYLEDLRNDKIYNINFNSYVTEISQNKPNYTYEWNHNDNTLNFYALCNHNNDFINIVVNYNILKATFQSVLYVWLNEIVKCSYNIFKVKWNNIATKINYLSTKSDNDVTVKEVKKFTKEIVNICKN
jgi:hypothetical protein